VCVMYRMTSRWYYQLVAGMSSGDMPLCATYKPASTPGVCMPKWCLLLLKWLLSNGCSGGAHLAVWQAQLHVRAAVSCLNEGSSGAVPLYSIGIWYWPIS
jgi:hypothetical protein